jgi:dihydrofolate reductase
MRKPVVHMQTTLNNRIANADGVFAALLKAMAKVVFSRTLKSTGDRVVVGGEIADELAALKRRDGKDILLSCGPATLAPLAATPGLIDEYLLVVHPAVIGAGPQLFEQVPTNLALRLVEARCSTPGRSCSATRSSRPSRLSGEVGRWGTSR